MKFININFVEYKLKMYKNTFLPLIKTSIENKLEAQTSLNLFAITDDTPLNIQENIKDNKKTLYIQLISFFIINSPYIK